MSTEDEARPSGSEPSAAARVTAIAMEIRAALVDVSNDDTEAVMHAVQPGLDKLGRVIESLARRLAVRFESETKMRETLAALFIINDWRKTTQHLSLEQRETWADACDHWASPPVDRWWRRESEWNGAASGKGDEA